MSGGFFRGTSADQDTRFSNKQAKLLKSQKFAPELEHLVDMTKVKMDVMRPWIAKRVTELIGFEDEVLINFIYGLLEGKQVNGKEVQISLTGFMERNTGKFMKELWSLLVSAQNNASGVPQQFLDAKEEETRKKKAETDRITNEIQRKKEKEIQELEEEKKKKMDGEANSKNDNVPLDPSSKHQRRARGMQSVNGIELNERNGSRGRRRVSSSPNSADRSPTPRGKRSRSITKSISRSRSPSDERRRSMSISKSHQQREASPSERAPRRSVTPRRGHLPSESPLRRRSIHSRRRSTSRSRRRSPSPIRHRQSPIRRRSRSPFHRRTRSPMWRRSRSPTRRSPRRYRSRSPMRRRSPSPIRRRSPSPLRRRSQSLSPVRRRSLSLSPDRSRSQSLSPVRRRSPSLSPVRRRSPSLSPVRGRSPSLSLVRRRSPSPARRRYRRSPSSSRRGSPPPIRRRSLLPGRRRSQTPVRHRSSSQERSSPSPVRRGPPPPIRRKSPKNQRRSPTQSPRERIRAREYSPVRRGSRRDNAGYSVETHKRSSSSERRPSVALRSPQRDSWNRKDSRQEFPSSPSLHQSPSVADSPLPARKRSFSPDKRPTSPHVRTLNQMKENPVRSDIPSSPREPRGHKPDGASSDDEKANCTREVLRDKSLGKNSSASDKLKDSRAEVRLKDESSLKRMRGPHSGVTQSRSDGIESRKKDREINRTKVDHEEATHKGIILDKMGRNVIDDDKGRSRSNDTKNRDQNVAPEDLLKLSRKADQDNESGSGTGSGSGSEESDKPKTKVRERRKHKRSERREVASDDDSSSDSHVEERKESKRRRKEERRLRKEEKRRRREERRRRKEEKRARKHKMKSVGDTSPSDVERSHGARASDGERTRRPESRSSDVEEIESEQKKLEIELREKALESLRAKKGISR